MTMILIFGVIAVVGYVIYTKTMCCNKPADKVAASPQAMKMMDALASIPVAPAVKLPVAKKPAAKKPAVKKSVAAKAPAKKVTKAPAAKKPAAKAKASSAQKAKK